jgi:hypothetical protein
MSTNRTNPDELNKLQSKVTKMKDDLNEAYEDKSIAPRQVPRPWMLVHDSNLLYTISGRCMETSPCQHCVLFHSDEHWEIMNSIDIAALYLACGKPVPEHFSKVYTDFDDELSKQLFGS